MALISMVAGWLLLASWSDAALGIALAFNIRVVFLHFLHLQPAPWLLKIAADRARISLHYVLYPV